MEGVLAELDNIVKDFDVPVVDLIKTQGADPFKILITTILSSRTKDGTTAKAAQRLFDKATSFDDLRKLSEDELKELIFPVGFYKTKAKNIKKIPDFIDEEFSGKIPEEVDNLVSLPGVGRKTANLVSAIAFGKDAICVDTHVHRICNRLGFISTSDPFETEMTLRERLPKRYWKMINRVLVAFGQNTCVPSSPFCSSCPISDRCEMVGVKRQR